MNNYNKEKLVKKIFWHSSYDLKTVETFLENMAADGYMFVSHDHQVFRFKRCEPVKLKFFVDIFHNSRKLDDSLGTMKDEYVTYCEECGWHFISNDGNMLFFYTIDDNATPIQTDNELRLKLINNQTLHTDGIGWIMWLFLILMQLCAFDWHNLANALIDEFSVLCAYACYPLIFVPDMVRYCIFYFRNRGKVKEGADITFYSAGSTFRFHFVRIAVAICLLIGLTFAIADSIYVACVVVAFAVVAIIIVSLICNHKSKKSGFSRMTAIAFNLNANMIIATIAALLVIFLQFFEVFNIIGSRTLFNYNATNHSTTINSVQNDTIPFSLGSLNALPEEADTNDTSVYPCASPFGRYDSFDEYVYDDSGNIIRRFEYDIIISNYDFIIDSYIEDFKSCEPEDFVDLTESEAKLWQANAVYLDAAKGFGKGTRLVVYGNRLLVISASYDFEYTDERIKAIGEAVKNY